MRRSILGKIKWMASAVGAGVGTSAALSIPAQADSGSRPSPAASADEQALGPVPAADPAGAASGANGSADQLSQVTVTGVRPLLHDKLSEDQLNTPQSITVVTSQLMSSQGANRLEDALRNVPGITLNAGEGAARGDTVNLRGFSAFNDFFLDGIRDAAIYTRDSFDLEAVEVIKGPSAVLFGRGSTGGAINQVSKAPQPTAFANIDAELATNDLYRTTVDLDAPIGTAIASRLNLMGESSAIAERDDTRNRRWGVAPALTFAISDADSLTLAYLHQQENNIPDVGMPFVDGRPAPIPPVARAADFGLSSSRTTADDDIITGRYRHDFDSNLSLADTLRYANYQFNYHFAAPNFGQQPPAAGQPLESILVGRDSPSSSGVQNNLDNQIDLTAHLATGWLAHTLVTGVELAQQNLHLLRYANPFNANNNWIPETPLLAPNPTEVLPFEPVSSIQDTSAPSGAAYVIDTVGFSPYVDLVAGYRFDYFSADYQQISVATGSQLHLQELNRVGSPRAALLVKPTPRQTYYVSFGTSFDPSAEALTLTTKTAGLGPVKAKTYEAGAKSQWLNRDLQFTAAIFHTEVDNAQTNDPDNPTITVLNGNERVNGLELGATGYLTRHWELYAGYSYLDGRTIASGTPADVGKVMPNVAHNALNLWTEYEFTRGWEIGGGGNWLGKRYADSAEAAYVPGYVVWNAMAAYRFSPQLELQLNGFNLLNRLYYDGIYYTSASENHVIPAPGRSVMLSAHVSL